MNRFRSEILSFGKTLALVAVTIVFAAMQLDDKLARFEQRFDKMTASITELNLTMKELTRKIDDGEKRAVVIDLELKRQEKENLKQDKEIERIRAHVGLN